MKTTFVLHGGATSKSSPQNDKFFRQFTELTEKEEVNILMCYWARPKDRWEGLLKRDRKEILKFSKKKVNFSLVENPADFFEKIGSYDVFYVAGGSAELIEPLYKEMKDMKEKIQGKIYIGSSMGAFMISSSYVLSLDAQDTSSVHTGLGLLPVNYLVHWDVEKNKENKIKMLKEKSSFPIVILDECEFVKIIV